MKVRTWGGSVAAVAATLAVVVPAQAASLDVKAAIVAQDHALHHSAAYRRLEHTTLGSLASPQKTIPKYRALARAVDRTATAVSRSTATTPTETLARRDWVAGARLEARSFAQIAVGLGDLEHGNKVAARRVARQAVVTLKRAALLTVKADRLLGLPKTD